MCLAVPGKIVSIENEDDIMRSGKVDFGGIARTINLAFVPDARINDYVLVHAGFAIGMVDEKKAVQTLSEFDLINDIKNDL
jgi:hydrogenase expression/formation protein HypC